METRTYTCDRCKKRVKMNELYRVTAEVKPAYGSGSIGRGFDGEKEYKVPCGYESKELCATCCVQLGIALPEGTRDQEVERIREEGPSLLDRLREIVLELIE